MWAIRFHPKTTWASPIDFDLTLTMMHNLPMPVSLLFLRQSRAGDGRIVPEILPFASWWRHQMETFSTLLAICAGNSPVPGEFPAQRPVTLSFDVFFDLRLNSRLSEQCWGWWFETLSRRLWRHCNVFRYRYCISCFHSHGSCILPYQCNSVHRGWVKTTSKVKKMQGYLAKKWIQRNWYITGY